MAFSADDRLIGLDTDDGAGAAGLYSPIVLCDDVDRKIGRRETT